MVPLLWSLRKNIPTEGGQPVQRPWGRQESSIVREQREGQCGWGWVSKGRGRVLGVLVLYPCKVSLNKLLSLSVLLPQLSISHTGFWVSTYVIPSSFISFFHFDHNLRTVIKHFLGHHDAPRTEQSCGFHNHLCLFCTIESRQSVPCMRYEWDSHFYVAVCLIS